VVRVVGTETLRKDFVALDVRLFQISIVRAFGGSVLQVVAFWRKEEGGPVGAA